MSIEVVCPNNVTPEMTNVKAANGRALVLLIFFMFSPSSGQYNQRLLQFAPKTRYENMSFRNAGQDAKSLSFCATPTTY